MAADWGLTTPGVRMKIGFEPDSSRMDGSPPGRSNMTGMESGSAAGAVGGSMMVGRCFP
jgi:hypothetical protein